MAWHRASRVEDRHFARWGVEENPRAALCPYPQPGYVGGRILFLLQKDGALTVQAIEIRACHNWHECVQCEQVQRQVWNMPDDRDVVPASLLITALKNGGLLLGAFDGLEMIGFVFGFLGSEMVEGRRRLKHCSHMLGVLPPYRSRGIGEALKWRQREELLKQGLELATWTYDPLQAVNAYLNLSRLGAIARRYVREAYGEMTDALNVGLASDRFEVEWYIRSSRVVKRAQAKQNPVLPSNAVRLFEIAWENDLPCIHQIRPVEGDPLLVEIPFAIHALKQRDLDLARAWREHTRAVFETAFTAGYAALELVFWKDESGRSRASYVLSRVPPQSELSIADW